MTLVPELGHFAFILAFCLALVQAFYALVGAHRGHTGWMAVARPAAVAQFAFLTLALAGLASAFVTNDFSVRYVAENSNSALPLIYRLCAVWGGHEGSMLLWVWVLGLWMLAVVAFSRGLPESLAVRVLGVMALIAAGLELFILLTSNPFARLWPAPAEGTDLNPLLQDPGMIVHPPMLYMGYVGLSVAFSLAVASLLQGRLDAVWARWSRPWTTVAWLFLTLGIMLGSGWAYYELGWGGWWFWDPVENASFMPWLVATALIHSLAVAEKRGAFKAWTVLLAIAAFSLSLLGTFLVRSGVLTSVHAFATDPTRGVFILALLTVVIGSSLVLYAWRAGTVQAGGSFEFLSREGLLLINNLFLAVACAAVLLGTLYPLAVDALGLGKLSVGPPYFNTVFVPLMLPLCALAGLGPLVRWKRHEPHQLLREIWRLAAASLLLGGALWLFLSGRTVGPMTAAGFLIAVWITVTCVAYLWRQVRHRRGVGRGLRSVSRAQYGMLVAHLGVAVFVAGATAAGSYTVERDVRLAVGERTTVAGHVFLFEGVRRVTGPNYEALEGQFRVFRDDRPVAVMQPQKRYYRSQQAPMTEAGIDGGFWRDLFVAMGEPVARDAWNVRVAYKPLIRWVWLGPILMALGGALAASDRRYRTVPVRDRAVAPRLATESGGAFDG